MAPAHTDVPAPGVPDVEVPDVEVPDVEVPDFDVPDFDVPDPGRCRAVNDILARIGDKWSVLIVMSLGDGAFRFNELKRRTDGISQRMLTLTLRGLERDGLVDREFRPTIPPNVSYRLTELGRSLRGPVSALGRWAIEHRGTVEQARTRYDGRPPPG